MPNPWFRLYSEFADDPKVQILSEAMQRRLVMLLCSRCKGETLQEQEMAFHWRVTEAEIAETKLLFMQKGFIDEGWNLLNWNKRQFISDSSTDRVRRLRERMKQDETLRQQHGTGRVTAPDTDTDTEHKKPSRAKREGRASDKTPDPRHTAFKLAFEVYVRQYANIDADWDGRQAKALSRFLASAPAMTLEHWQRVLTHRGQSDGIAHAEPLANWVADAKKFYPAPLDRFGKPKAQSAQASRIIFSDPGEER